MFVHSSQKVDATQVSTDRQVDKQNTVYTYNEVLFSLSKEGNYDTWYHMDEPWGYNANWNKSNHKKRATIWFHLYDVFKVVKFIEWCSPGTGGEEKGELLNKRYRVTVLQDEKVLEICFTTMWIYLTLLHLKIVKISF